MRELYLNGRFLPEDEACVPVMDRGFLFGDSVYEVIPAYGGRLFRLQEHLRRLSASLRAIGMEPPLSDAEWEQILLRLAAQSPAPEQQLYLQITRGSQPIRSHFIPEGIAPTVLAFSMPVAERDPQIARGISAITVEDQRWQHCDIKATTLLANVLAASEARQRRADEAIFIRDGHPLEGTASNLFIVEDGVVLTPPKGPQLLPGITRDLVLELAREHGLPYRETAIDEVQLRRAKEIWLTSSTREIMPVIQLDGAPVANGRPGPIWERMNALFSAYKQTLRSQ